MVAVVTVAAETAQVAAVAATVKAREAETTVAATAVEVSREGVAVGWPEESSKHLDVRASETTTQTP